MNKIKKRVTFYIENHETGVPEMQLLGAVAGHIGVSTEDFVRGAALEVAAKYLQDYQANKAKEIHNAITAQVAAEGGEAAATEGAPEEGAGTRSPGGG